MEMPHIHRPTPRRALESVSSPTDSAAIPSPPPETPRPYDTPRTLDGARDSSESYLSKGLDVSSPPSRQRSVLNLTASTLAGIYSSTVGDGGASEVPTPWGTGAQTPAYRRSLDASDRADFFRMTFETQPARPKILPSRRVRHGLKQYYLPLMWQTLFLFMFGMGFGLMVTHLQRTQQIAPVPIPSFARTSWGYQAAWGLLGVMVGNILPWIDDIFSNNEELVMDGRIDIAAAKKTTRSRSNAADMNGARHDSSDENGLGPFWLSAVRSIGAFVGIAFAVRRVPWQSTLQVSLTLAATNPVLWYLIDRSKSGFALSTATGIVGSALLLLFSPDFVPVPAIHQDQTSEKFGVYLWLSSILFCTSLCFGAIGRRLRF